MARIIQTLGIGIPIIEKGAPLGVGTLDAAGKQPISEVNAALLGAVDFQGVWNADTNTPAFEAASAANKGHYFVVSAAGSTSVDGETDWKPPDWRVSNGTTWDKVDNTDPLAPIKYVSVFTEANFGTFVSDVVDLENKVYVLKNDIALSSGGFNKPDGITANIRSEGRSIYKITYTNANSPLFAGVGAGDLRIQDFNVDFDSATQDIFNLVGDGTGSFAMEFVEITAVDNAGSGLIDDFAGGEIINAAINGSAGELLIRDCDMGISLCGIANSVDTSAALIAYETTEPHTLEIFNCRILPRSGESALRISSGTQDAGSRVLIDHLVTGAPLGLMFDASGLDELDPRVFSNFNVGRRTSGTFIECNLDGNTETTAIPAVDAWVLVNATTWVADEANRMVGTTDGMLTHTGLEPTRIRMDGNLTLDPAMSNKLIAATYVKIGVEGIAITFANATNEITAAVAEDDTISFFNTPGTLPAELRKDVVYYVIGTTTKQLAYTEGGSAIAFTDDGTGSPELDRIEFHGSRSAINVVSGVPGELNPKGLAEISTGQKIGQYIRNVSDNVDIDVIDGYSRV